MNGVKNNTTVPVTDLEQIVSNAALATDEDETEDSRICIHVHSVRKRLTDADGISAKAAIDGLVNAGILADDSPEIVKQVTYSQEKGDPEETIITLTSGNH